MSLIRTLAALPRGLTKFGAKLMGVGVGVAGGGQVMAEVVAQGAGGPDVAGIISAVTTLIGALTALVGAITALIGAGRKAGAQPAYTEQPRA